ncbi:hypothetical protein, partial [Streptomyces sp. SID13726]|uniref:hypothetical protein n=1 Tax=Streptomyces sp. SID13726 TaxID=2706058 RepID=UPI001941D827
APAATPWSAAGQVPAQATGAGPYGGQAPPSGPVPGAGTRAYAGQVPGPAPAPVPGPTTAPAPSWGTVGASGAASPWGSSRRAGGERVTSRVRNVVEGLPDWEPLPPGETVVRRPGGSV